jgi:hypothetical protein
VLVNSRELSNRSFSPEGGGNGGSATTTTAAAVSELLFCLVALWIVATAVAGVIVMDAVAAAAAVVVVTLGATGFGPPRFAAHGHFALPTTLSFLSLLELPLADCLEIPTKRKKCESLLLR